MFTINQSRLGVTPLNYSEELKLAQVQECVYVLTRKSESVKFFINEPQRLDGIVLNIQQTYNNSNIPVNWDLKRRVDNTLSLARFSDCELECYILKE